MMVLLRQSPAGSRYVQSGKEGKDQARCGVGGPPPWHWHAAGRTAAVLLCYCGTRCSPAATRQRRYDRGLGAGRRERKGGGAERQQLWAGGVAGRGTTGRAMARPDLRTSHEAEPWLGGGLWRVVPCAARSTVKLVAASPSRPACDWTGHPKFLWSGKGRGARPDPPTRLPVGSGYSAHSFSGSCLGVPRMPPPPTLQTSSVFWCCTYYTWYVRCNLHAPWIATTPTRQPTPSFRLLFPLMMMMG